MASSFFGVLYSYLRCTSSIISHSTLSCYDSHFSSHTKVKFRFSIFIHLYLSIISLINLILSFMIIYDASLILLCPAPCSRNLPRQSIGLFSTEVLSESRGLHSARPIAVRSTRYSHGIFTIHSSLGLTLWSTKGIERLEHKAFLIPHPCCRDRRNAEVHLFRPRLRTLLSST